MLSLLKIKNLAIIEELSVEFKNNLNILTGETGAGKSILIKALQFIMGSRANVDLIRDLNKELEVHALFENLKAEVKLSLSEQGVELDDGQLLIKRTLNKAGSGKIFINGNITTATQLKKIASLLMEICGQHEHQLLTDEDNQRKLLDGYADSEVLLKQIRQQVIEINEIKSQIEDLSIDEDVKNQRIDFLKYQIKEIEDLDLDEAEEADLIKKSQKLTGLKDLAEVCNLVEFGLYGDTPVMDILEKIESKIKQTKKFDPQIADQEKEIEIITQKLTNLGDFFIKYGKKLNQGEENLDEVFSRIEEINRLKKKFGGTVKEVLAKAEVLSKELSDLENQEAKIKQLKSSLKNKETKYFEIAKKLNSLRVKSAKTLSEKITAELQDLKMSGAVFKIEIELTDKVSSVGADLIDFKISPNKGEGLKPLAKIASGGELSRMLLAINRILTETSQVNSFIFDEIDAGIGGETGLIVGQKLKEISKKHQVICITHLAQVAVFAAHQYEITKKEVGKKVNSEILLLTEAERVKEIARMLGGNMVKDKSLEHAAEMLKKAK